MSLTIPSTEQIFNRINTDIINTIQNLNPYLRLSLLRAISSADANAFYELYKTVENLIELYMDDTTTDEYLKRKAAVFDITQNPATVATGNVVFTGNDGTTIPEGTQATSSSGFIYETTQVGSISDTTINIVELTRSGSVVTVKTSTSHNLASSISVIVAGADQTEYNGSFQITVLSASEFTYTIETTPTTPATGTMTVSAVYANIPITSLEYGENQNLLSGTGLSLITQIAGVNEELYVDFEEITGGSDFESLESLKSRYLARLKNTPANFNKKSIELQAKLVNGVTRVWVQGAGELESSFTPTSLVRNGDYLAIINKADHGLYNGQTITVAGVDQIDYNIFETKVFRIDKDNIAYVVKNSPTTPATGTIIVSYSISSLGQARVFFTRDNDDTIIPTGDEITNVYNKLLEIKPIAMSPADLIVQAPHSVVVDFVFTQLSPNSLAMRSAITQALKSYFLSSTDLNKNVRQVDYNSIINSTIDSGGNAVESFILSDPSGEIAIGIDAIPVLGTITYP